MTSLYACLNVNGCSRSRTINLGVISVRFVKKLLVLMTSSLVLEPKSLQSSSSTGLYIPMEQATGNSELEQTVWHQNDVN